MRALQCWSSTERRSTCVWTCVRRASLKVEILMLVAGAHSDPVLLNSITHYCSFKSFRFNLRVWHRLEQAGLSPALKKRRTLRSKLFYYRQAFYSANILFNLFFYKWKIINHSVTKTINIGFSKLKNTIRCLNIISKHNVICTGSQKIMAGLN